MTNSRNEIENYEITETVAKLEDMKMEIDEKNEEVKQLQKEMAVSNYVKKNLDWVLKSLFLCPHFCKMLQLPILT